MKNLLVILSAVALVTGNLFAQSPGSRGGDHWIVRGRVSWFGGPHDSGVKPNEGLALLEKQDLKDPFFKALFLPFQPKRTSGLARRLDPNAKYIALRWDYRKHPREKLRNMRCIVSANGKVVRDVIPVDFGPARWTKKKMDVSPGVMEALELETGDYATVVLVEG